MNKTLCDGIEWVGYVDWTVRDFHGYRTGRGSSYNSYLIRDKKNVLIDAVKAPYAEYLREAILKRIPDGKLDYVVCNHAEPDHSGGLSLILNAFPSAKVICNAKCRDALSAHYDISGWKFRVVNSGDSLSIGKRSLTFIDTPMVHWPESMFTYVPEEKLLFSMDAFGQHYASHARFDDETDLNIVMAEAKTYFANIVMLYGRQISKVLEQASKLDIQMIAPSHGVIWRKNLASIISAYRDWVVCKSVPKVLVMYDTMWKSTEKMAGAIAEGVMQSNVEVKVHNVRVTDITELATESLDAAVIVCGSPTLNTTLMPQMAAVLTYLKGLKPAGKAGFAFGSYGWGQNGPADVEKYLGEMKVNILRSPLVCRFSPSKEVLEECVEAGRVAAKEALSLTG